MQSSSSSNHMAGGNATAAAAAVASIGLPNYTRARLHEGGTVTTTYLVSSSMAEPSSPMPPPTDDDDGVVLEPVPRADDDDGGAVAEPAPRADDDEGWSDGEASAQRPSRGDLILEACVDAAVDYFARRRDTYPAIVRQGSRLNAAAARELDDAEAGAAAADGDGRRLNARELREAMRAAAGRVRRRGALRAFRESGGAALRRAVTGDPGTRVRDHVRRVAGDKRRAMAGRVKTLRRRAREPVVVRAVDKALFTLGVGWVVATEYVVLARPEHFGAWYVASLAPLLAHRVVTYRRRRWAYFCLDFCYALNALCMGLAVAALAGGRARGRLFALAFALANGPLLSAILVWRNSFIFHSLDHVTSTALHALPPMWTYAVRWGGGGDAGGALGFPAAADAVAAYAAWQALYVLKTEVFDAAYLESTPDESTSLRWIARDGKNAMNRLCKGVLVSGGLMRRDEDFDPCTRKTKLTFWAAQLLYTVVTLAPAPLMWRSRRAHEAFLIAMFTTAVYNGASYYIEVFSRRYNLKFDVADDDAGDDGDDDGDDEDHGKVA